MSDKDFLEKAQKDCEFRSAANSRDNYACVLAAIFY